MSDTWRDVAMALGERMVHRANQCTAGYWATSSGPIDTFWPEDGSGVHRVAEERVDDCPFCMDTVAYRRFQRKVESERRRAR